MGRGAIRALVIALAVAVLANACTGAESTDDGPNIDDFIARETPTPIIFDLNEPDPEFAGTTTQRRDIEAGDCFNDYLWTDAADFVQQATTLVRCNGPHDNEAYFRVDYPAGDDSPYPLGAELELWADGACLEEFDEFVGLEYVLSELEIGVIVPDFVSWTDQGDRAVICFVFPDRGGRLLRSMRNSGV